MRVQHTPGPWFAATDGPYKVASVSSKTGVYADCIPFESAISADARLIAAAPDLLEALRALMRGGEYSGEGRWGRIVCPNDAAMNQAAAAIAKATGEQ